ncbi:hypothetical protein [uncultured Bacteroides sp.]|uniref:hypothetical protein n=1 Tax=uncultured Bacteroides sp. TaxID=162156 RepID=UPI0025900D3A|nr:hypothetical protein [uncultured Bacteroides sp.]
MKPHVIADVTGKAFFSLSPHAQTHGTVKGIQRHIQAAAFSHLHFLLFHKLYIINCFFLVWNNRSDMFCPLLSVSLFLDRIFPAVDNISRHIHPGSLEHNCSNA